VALSLSRLKAESKPLAHAKEKNQRIKIDKATARLMASNWQRTFRTSLQASTFGRYVLVMNKSMEKFIQDEEDKS